MSLWQQSLQEPTKPNLVLLHGWGLNSAIWSGLLPTLGAHFNWHCIDLPGFGRSAGQTQTCWATAVAQVAAQIPPDSLLLGWSLGGLFAQAVALQIPERIAGLVLVASSPCFRQQSDWPWAMKAEVLAEFQSKLQQDYAKTLEQFLALQALGSPSLKQDVRFLKSVVLAQGQASDAALSVGLDWLAAIDLRAALSGLLPPSLWLFGKLDALVPAACAQAIPTLLPSAQVQLWPKASHAPFLSQPDEFCRLLNDFAVEIRA